MVARYFELSLLGKYGIGLNKNSFNRKCVFPKKLG